MKFSRDQLIGSGVLVLLAGACVYATWKYAPSGTAFPDCATVFAQGGEELPYPLSCSLAVGRDAATLSVDEDGSLTVRSGTRSLLKLYNFDVYGDEALPAFEPGSWDEKVLMPGAVEVVDVNFDGYADLRVREWSAAYQSGYEFYLYDPTRRAFGGRGLLVSLGFMTSEAWFDPDQGVIHAFHKGRGIGDLFVGETYQFENGTYVLVAREEQDFADETEETYLYIKEERMGGEMMVVERKILAREEVWGE